MEDIPNMIGKGIVDWQHYANVDGLVLRQEVKAWTTEKLLPGIDETLSRLSSPGMITRINTLTLEVNLDSYNDWQETLLKKINSALTDAIRKFEAQVIKDQTENKLSEPEQTLELLVHFLKYGYLPWWGGKMSFHEFQIRIEDWIKDRKNKDLVKQLWPLVGDDEPRQRMISQLSQEMLETLLIDLQDVYPATLEQLKTDALAIFALGKNPKEISNFIKLLKSALVAVLARSVESRWDEVFAMHILEKVASQKPDILDLLEKNHTRLFSTAFIPVIEKMKQRSALLAKKSPEREITQKFKEGSKIPPKDLAEGLWVYNAGLIILAPFLPIFFTRLDVADNEKLSDPRKAVALLHYLETGNENFGEYETVLSKIICGLSLQKPIDTEVRLTEAEKSESESLLISVIEHWNILKNTSVEGLRLSFLQRKGKLVFTGDEWNLHVEHAAYDVVLQHLPWNIHLVRLPWMKHMIKTHWI